MKDVIIIGAGQSAGQCASSLRNGGFEGSIAIVGEENYPPYQRPPLSKGYLSDEVGLERVYTKKNDFYESNSIELITGTRVNKINRNEKYIQLSSEENISYEKLVIATGSRVRKLNVEGSDLENIYYLRGIDDSQNIKNLIKNKHHLTIVGAGYIGLEVAAVAVKAGKSVSVIEMTDRVMNRTVDPIISEYYEKLHKNHGVDIYLDSGLQGFEGSKEVSKVICSNLELEAEGVVIGAGILPNVELALEANLECEDGILVNEFCETKDKDIYACGDCTNHPNKLLNRRLRLESVHNALEQAKTVASNIVGQKKEYNQIPWFWSDQYDHKLQIVGLSGEHDEVILKGSMEEKRFLVFYLKRGHLISVNAVNSPKEFLICKNLVANKIKLTSDIILKKPVESLVELTK